MVRLRAKGSSPVTAVACLPQLFEEQASGAKARVR